MSNNCPFIEPFAKSELIKKPNVFNLNYTNQDFWSMKNRLIEFTQQRFGKEFNDFVESSLAIMPPMFLVSPGDGASSLVRAAAPTTRAIE